VSAQAQALERQLAAAGIHRLAIPTPFPVGRVNAYLIEDTPLTLIDCGPASARALEALESALARLGKQIADIELLLITHQHADHVGLAGLISRRSDAQVAAIAPLADYMANFRAHARADQAFAEEMMLAHGVPREIVLAGRAASASLRAWSDPVALGRELADGERIDLGQRSLRVILRPGHSPSDTIFLDEERRIAFGGDHLLAEISSNPTLSRPLGAAPDPPYTRERSLPAYLRSLEATRSLPAQLILPGHGEPFGDHARLIDSRLSLHRRRARKILKLLEGEAMSAHALARTMWKELAITQAYLTLSELVGHLDLLEDSGAVEACEREGLIRYRALARRIR
jgi:glyoxylase-like metal-dependent hydrolase (beta-lactamase superfamily II)